MNRSNNKIMNSKGNVQRCKVDRTDMIKKFTERLTECCHTPDLVQAFSEENGVLNHVTYSFRVTAYFWEKTKFYFQDKNKLIY